jgi:hypothetical protein
MANLQREDPGRTRDSVEQLEDAEIPNPITQDAELTEPGEGFEPAADDVPDDPEREGPVPRTTQMPR